MDIGSVSVTMLFIVLFHHVMLDHQTAASFADESFINCLFSHSPNATSISNLVYSPSNSSYRTILDARIRNLKFLTPSTPGPRLIIMPSSDAHVQSAVICAKEHSLQIRVRSGGHDFEGLSYTADVPFIILDMFNLDSIHVNVTSQTAWVEVGATVGQLYYRIAEKSRTLAFPAAICPSVGTGGHISGGGWGMLVRKYGLAADNVVDAHIVDVNGRFLDRKSMGEDLFWAIRGGGAASFGVVVAWKIKLLQVPETITVMNVSRTLQQNATKILHRWQYIAHKLPKEATTTVIMTTENSVGQKPTAVMQFQGLFLGRADQLLELMRETFPELGMNKRDCREVRWIESIPYMQDYPEGVPLEILLNRSVSPINPFKAKSDYVQEPISESGLRGICNRMLQTDIGLTRVTFEALGGIMDEIPSYATPFPHRTGNIYQIVYFKVFRSTSIEAVEDSLNWIRKLYDYMRPYVSRSPRQAYLNYRDLDVGTNPRNGSASYMMARTWGEKFFVKNFDRLVRVKTKVDPQNIFRNEQSIPSLSSKHSA